MDTMKNLHLTVSIMILDIVHKIVGGSLTVDRKIIKQIIDILKAGIYLGRARKYINDDSYLDTKDQLKQLTELYQEKLKEYEISTES